MPVTKQVYTANNIWTPAQLASLFRSAFIDAGLMTEWHDSFLSGTVENRVLEVVYDATKVYGKAYYWFMFTTTGAFHQYATGWNTTTKQPTGTLSLDYPNNVTNSTGSMAQFSPTLSTSLPVQLVRYTSQANSTHSWFLIGQSNSHISFGISHSSHKPVPWLDLDKNSFHHLLLPQATTSGRAGGLTMIMRVALRRSGLVGIGYTGASTATSGHSINVVSYVALGRESNATDSNCGWNGSFFPYGIALRSNQNIGATAIPLPVASSTGNPAYASNYNPVCTGMPYSLWLNNSPLPNDFGMIPHYANNTMQAFDTFIVSPGVEEWEILTVSNSTVISTGVSFAFAARIV